MPITNEKMVKALSEALFHLATKIESSAGVSAQATIDATQALVQGLGSMVIGGGGTATEISTPPPGGYKVKNIYVNQDGKLVVQYDDGGGFSSGNNTWTDS